MRKDTNHRAGLPVTSGVLAAALMLGSGLAQASSAAAADFDELDQDGNYTISQEEFQAAEDPAADFGTLDVDGDNELSRTEFAAMEDATGTDEWATDESTGQQTAQGQTQEPGYDQQTGTQENRWEDDAAGQTASQQGEYDQQTGTQEDRWESDASSTAQSGTTGDTSGDTTGDTSSGDTMAQSGSESSQSGSSQQTAQQGGSQGSQAFQELASQEDRLSDFVKAVEEAGLADALTRGDTKYTIFAPTNEAFDQSGRNLQQLMSEGNNEELVNVLRAHIVADDVDPEMAKRITQAKTLAGGTVPLSSEGDELKVGDAKVVASNIQQGNLRVYAIDGLLEAGEPGIVSTSGQGSGSGQDTASGQSDTAQSSTGQTATGQTAQSDTGQSATGPSTAGQTAGTSGQSATSQAGGAMAGMRFDELDEDGNGYLDEQELQQAEQDLAAQQDQLDSDGDGQVSRTEFAAFEQESDMMGPESGIDSAGDTPSASDMPPHHEGSQEWDPDEE